MGGPGASVLLRDPLTRRQEEDLDVWLRSIAQNLEKGARSYEFWLDDGAFPGTVSRCTFYLSLENAQTRWDADEVRNSKELLGYLPTQAIEVSSGCNQREDHTTLGQFVLHLARIYDGLISMDGAIEPPMKPENQKRYVEFWTAPPSEHAKARKAYFTAKLREFRDSLPPGTTPFDIQKYVTDPASPLRAIEADVEARYGPLIPPEIEELEPSLDEIHAYVSAMPGTVYEIGYTTADGRRWVFHIVDVPFFQAWMRHPHFHMIK
ncbi:MAG TPA: DUF6368 family protein [Ktedonobacteraceae bacterium]|nr:DUF6368 family protein [Ktedonobacteraceae bacterium]